MAKRAEDDSEYTKARNRVEGDVPKYVETWADLLGLTRTDERFDQFKEDVTEALHACMRAHIAEKYRRHKRFSDLKDDFEAVAKAATAAKEALCVLEDTLKRLPPMQHDPAFRLAHDPWATAFELDGLAKAACRHANECKSADRGGQLPMRAFGELVVGLVRAYKGATGEIGTGRTAREGRLLDFLEAVLPIACNIAKSITGKPLKVSKYPGEFLHRTAERLRVS